MARKTRAKSGAYNTSVSSRLLYGEIFIILSFIPFYAFSHDLTIMGGMINFTSDKMLVTMPLATILSRVLRKV
ncbi:MAG: hypothetical protein LBL31_06420 [Spirochaetaceae bacterium]|nr:hypothetical protein [Spirochaetaceae bacterium]